MHLTSKRVMSHLDKPRRFMGFTLDEVVVFSLGLMLLVASSQKWLVGCLIGVLYGLLKHFKQGRTPQFLLIRMYWALPSFITEVLVPRLPPSYRRTWRA